MSINAHLLRGQPFELPAIAGSSADGRLSNCPLLDAGVQDAGVHLV